MAKYSVPSLESLVTEMQQSKIGLAYFQASLVSVLKTAIQNDIQREKKQVPHMGILCLKEKYKIFMDELLSSNYSSLYLWREPIMTETHFCFSSVDLWGLQVCQYGHICAAKHPLLAEKAESQCPSTWLPSMAYSTPIFEGIAGRYMWNALKHQDLSFYSKVRIKILMAFSGLPALVLYSVPLSYVQKWWDCSLSMQQRSIRQSDFVHTTHLSVFLSLNF